MFGNKKLKQRIEELEKIVENYRVASEISDSKGVKYVPADEKTTGMYLPLSEKIKIDRAEQERIEEVTE